MKDKQEIQVRDLDLIFVDTELTGLDSKHEIVEIGFVKVKAGTYDVITEKVIKIKPMRLQDANPDSLVISGYNAKDWADAVDLKTGLEEFLSYTEDCMLVGQNLAIDWFFIKKSLDECGLKANYYYKGLDTFTLAWSVLKDDPALKRFSLSELAPRFNIDPGIHHRALDDAKTTFQVFLELIRPH
jgi:DNA polymerase III epsilon subunit-like protein